MRKYSVEVEHAIVYVIEIEANSSSEAMAQVDFMIEDGAMPKDIGTEQDDRVDVIHSYPIHQEESA